MLREIKKPNRDYARRVLQCLVVAIRPLRVEELAEVLAVDFDDTEGVPELKPSRRWEDQEQALLASCSSLIVVVGRGHSRVVQFSHFSVKEFLTSARLATSSQDVSLYHISLKPAHTILAQACVSVLLQLHDRDEQGNSDEQDDSDEEDVDGKNGPLARYAAEHWVRHAQFEDVVSRIKGIEYLFDSDKPYFAAWCQLHNIDTYPSDLSVFSLFVTSRSGTMTPLYYAALCGFSNLVELLIVKHPQHVKTIGGRYWTPALAALAGRHFQIAEVLHRNGSSVDQRGYDTNSPLHSAARYEDLEMVQVLLDYGLDVNAQNRYGSTPLAYATYGHFNNPKNVRLLLDHGADPNARRNDRTAPLHRASQNGNVEIARLLVEHGASVGVQDKSGMTPLDVATEEQHDEIMKLLLEQCAE
jgi:hypothetical protein